MPARRIPSLRHQKSRNLAVVRLNGRDIYLGPWGTEVSRREYDRLIGEWLASGRVLVSNEAADERATIVEICAAFLVHAKTHYREGSMARVKMALRYLREAYGHTPADEFGPLAMENLRNQLIAKGQSRKYINDLISQVKLIFKWAAAKEMIDHNVPLKLANLGQLAKGRSQARETEPIRCVQDEIVDKTIPFLPPVVADMVRFQRLTGTRPGEVCILRLCDIDQSSSVWWYRPASHKTEHHGKDRVVAIGPKAQSVLQPFLQRPRESYCFSPAEGEASRRSTLHLARSTPLNRGNRPGSNRRKKPKVTAGKRYTTDSYRRAIHRGCERAGIEKWSPNQLRHTVATEIRKSYGIEAARVSLGQSNLNVTEIYAERDLTLVSHIAQEMG